ncbi:MAG: efflux RND transporter periplasmic adaptor subunit, partial [Gemmatimonadaceae bacterium]|nr:efflux RND transporter periplasmic adaptor subunit [Gemmatimonadaceae bacterium]
MTPTTNDRSADLSRGRRRAIGTAAIVLLAAIAFVAIIYWRATATRNSTTTTATAADSMPTARGEKSGMPMASPADTGTAIQITASQLRQFGITFGTAERRTLQSTVRTVGTVMVDEARRSQFAPKFGGFVERLYVDQTGQRVRRGDPLMDVYSPELVAAEQELLIARSLEKSTGGSAMPGVPPATIDLLAGARRR